MKRSQTFISEMDLLCEEKNVEDKEREYRPSMKIRKHENRTITVGLRAKNKCRIEEQDKIKREQEFELDKFEEGGGAEIGVSLVVGEVQKVVTSSQRYKYLSLDRVPRPPSLQHRHNHPATATATAAPTPSTSISTFK